MDVARSAPCGYPPGTPQAYDRSVVVSASSPGPGLLPLGSLPLPPQHGVQLLQTPPRATLPGSAMAASVQKPQHLWRDEIHNQDRPFVPKLRSKPNALTPFELRLEHAPPTDEASSYHDASHRGAASWYANPYAAELADFAPCEAQLLPGADRPPRPLHSTVCMWVGTEAALQQVVQKLSGLDEFAVDAEQHSYRSYRGNPNPNPDPDPHPHPHPHPDPDPDPDPGPNPNPDPNPNPNQASSRSCRSARVTRTS